MKLFLAIILALTLSASAIPTRTPPQHLPRSVVSDTTRPIDGGKRWEWIIIYADGRRVRYVFDSVVPR